MTRRSFVGIGTDELRSRFWDKSLETGEIATDTPVTDISEVIKRCLIRKMQLGIVRE